MTMPHLMNCSHSETGWCLECVRNMWLEYNKDASSRLCHCFVCEKQLEWHSASTRQPYDGGEVQVRFDYGSKHDECIGSPCNNGEQKNVGYICDDCWTAKKRFFELWSVDDTQKWSLI